MLYIFIAALQSRIKDLEQQNEAMKKELLENEEIVAEWQRYSHDLLSKQDNQTILTKGFNI